MKLTNRFGLPDILVRAVEKAGGDYDRGKSTLTTTELIGPPRISRFIAEHGTEIEEDVTERLASFLGVAVHAFIERAHGHSDLVEERVYEEVDGEVVGGKFDHYEDGVLRDWKTTSVWSYILEPGHLKQDYISQGNVNARLMRVNGFPVHRIEVGYIFTDWSIRESRKNPDYPRAKATCVQVPDWGDERTLAFMRGRIALHREARSLTPEQTPLCTPSERWAKPSKYAVMKDGRKSAVRLLDTYTEAEQYMAENGLKNSAHSIVHRPGEDVRCLDYCPARKLCSHGREVANGE